MFRCFTALFCIGSVITMESASAEEHHYPHAANRIGASYLAPGLTHAGPSNSRIVPNRAYRYGGYSYGGYGGFGYSGFGYGGYSHDPYRGGSFNAPDLLDDPYFRAQHKFDSHFPGRYSRRPPLQWRHRPPVRRRGH